MTLSQAIFCVGMGVLAFIGLVMASAMHGHSAGQLGLALSVCCIIAIFVMIHRTTGRPR